MVSRKVKLRDEYLKQKERYRKGSISKTEFNEIKNNYEASMKLERDKSLYKLATAPSEKVIGTGQEAARRELISRQTAKQPRPDITDITQVTNSLGQTYKGKVVDGQFIGVRKVTEGEQRRRANIRAGFFSIYDTPSKSQADIIVSQTQTRASLGIYSPLPLSTDVQYKFEKPKTETPKPEKVGFAKQFYSNIITSSEKASMKFKYGGYKGAFVVSEVTGGAVSTFVYPFANPKEFAIGIIKLGIPIYYPEIARNVYKEATERPFRFGGSLLGGYAFSKVVVQPTIKAGYTAYAKGGDYYRYSFKPAATNLIPERIRFGGYTKRQFYQMKTEVAEASNLYDVQSRTPFKIGSTVYIPDESFGNVPEFKIRDIMQPVRTGVQPAQNVYVGISSKTGKPVTIGIEEGIRTGKLIQVQEGTRVMIVPFNLGFGRNVLEFEQPLVTTPKETFTFGKSAFNYPEFKQTQVKMYSDNVGAVFNEGAFTTSVNIPTYYYLPKYETVQNLRPLNVQTSITREREEVTPSIRNAIKFEVTQTRVQAQTPVQIQRQRQRQKPVLLNIQKPILEFKPQPFRITETVTSRVITRTPKPIQFPTFFGSKKKTTTGISFGKGFKVRQPKSYVPSLRASLFNLKGFGKVGKLTGVEERLIIGE